MLKKLFIGLIILSTLASEGVVNFSGRIYSLYLCSANELSLNNGEVITLGQQDKQDESALISRDISNTAFIFTFESEQKFKSSKALELLTGGSFVDLQQNAFGFDNICSLSSSRAFVPFFGLEKGAIVKKSDSSPPYI